MNDVEFVSGQIMKVVVLEIGQIYLSEVRYLTNEIFSQSSWKTYNLPLTVW